MIRNLISACGNRHAVLPRVFGASLPGRESLSGRPLAAPTTACPDTQCRWRSNRSRRGLYNGKDIRTGNNVSFSMRATKRTFKPNVFLKRVYSETLDEMVRFHLTTSTLRAIDKAGGLDNYLLTSKHVAEGEGLAVKKRILRRQKMAALKEATNEALESEGTHNA